MFQKAAVKNIVRKGEIACNKHFLHFSHCFLTYMSLVFHFKCTLRCRLQLGSNWTSLKFCRLVMTNGLTKWMEFVCVSVEQTLWEKNKMLVTTFPPFPQCFKRLLSSHPSPPPPPPPHLNFGLFGQWDDERHRSVSNKQTPGSGNPSYFVEIKFPTKEGLFDG